MSIWAHLDLNFKNYDAIQGELANNSVPFTRPGNTYKALLSYLKRVIDSSSDLINRYFFLFEFIKPNGPDLFLALEIKDDGKIESVKKIIETIEKPAFVSSIRFWENSGDEGHKEATLDMFHASTKYAFFRIRDDYNPDDQGNNEFKIIHCFCNQQYVDWLNEVFFCSYNATGRTKLILEERKRYERQQEV